MKQISAYMYQCHEIELNSGRVVNLIRLEQDRTYGGQLEGLPSLNGVLGKTRSEFDLSLVREKKDWPVVLVDDLTLLWYQRAYAMPIDELVLPRIKALDWDGLAKNDYLGP